MTPVSETLARVECSHLRTYDTSSYGSHLSLMQYPSMYENLIHVGP